MECREERAKGEKEEEKVAIFCQLSELLCHGSSLYYCTVVFTARGQPSIQGPTDYGGP